MEPGSPRGNSKRRVDRPPRVAASIARRGGRRSSARGRRPSPSSRRSPSARGAAGRMGRSWMRSPAPGRRGTRCPFRRGGL